MELRGGELGEVASPDALESSELQALAQTFESQLGHPVEFQSRIEPDLLAGLKVTVGGKTYDGTLRSQLNRLREGFIIGTGRVH